MYFSLINWTIHLHTLFPFQFEPDMGSKSKKREVTECEPEVIFLVRLRPKRLHQWKFIARSVSPPAQWTEYDFQLYKVDIYSGWKGLVAPITTVCMKFLHVWMCCRRHQIKAESQHLILIVTCCVPNPYYILIQYNIYYILIVIVYCFIT